MNNPESTDNGEIFSDILRRIDNHENRGTRVGSSRGGNLPPVNETPGGLLPVPIEEEPVPAEPASAEDVPIGTPTTDASDADASDADTSDADAPDAETAAMPIATEPSPTTPISYEEKPTMSNYRSEESEPKKNRFWESFKTFAIIFSFLINILLLLLVVWFATQYAKLQQTQVQPLIGGLYKGFNDLNAAVIEAQIPVNQELPISFNVPVRQNTTVVLVAPVKLENVPAIMDLGAAGTINGRVTLSLPQGMQLPVAMDMNIPVQDSVPVNLMVDVKIPVNQTQLNQPFEELKSLVETYDDNLSALPGYTPVVPDTDAEEYTPGGNAVATPSQ
ncbi:MAG TPA: hypothetical protein PK299_06135 [Anaerolineales bacterium]|nr:hypothetical protein [Anaerolineales bacterium]